MTDVDYPGAIPMWVPTNDLFTTNTHQAIVVHKTASGNTAQDIAQYFINASPGPSVHYIVGLDGTIVQCAPEALGSGGNCCLETGHDPFWDQFGNVNMNTVTLSIEHVDPTPDNSTPCPQAQIDASFALVLHLAQKYNIAPDHIKPHSSLDPISRARCPGNYPFSDLIAYVEQGGSMALAIDQASNYFSANSDGSIWTCKQNNLLVGHGILSYYCQVGGGSRAPLFGVTLLGLPRTNEIGVSGHSGVVLQVFERGVVAYDPGHTLDNPPGSGDVYQMHIDSGPGSAQLLSLLGVAAPSVDVAAVVAALKTLQAYNDEAIQNALHTLGS